MKYLGDVSSSRTADYRGTADLSESDSKNWFQEETFSRETKKYLRQEFGIGLQYRVVTLHKEVFPAEFECCVRQDVECD